MYDVTHKPIYQERAEKWFQVMKSRMKLRDDGKYFVWNYWDPGVPWDHQRGWLSQALGGRAPERRVLRRWMSTAIVAAYEHGLVFTKEDIARLIATNRDFMWNQQIKNAKFQRIDGGKPEPRWTNSPGCSGPPWRPMTRRCGKSLKPTIIRAIGAALTATPEWVARFGRSPKPRSKRRDVHWKGKCR